MPVPNTITRIINRNSQVVAFDLSRIHTSIARAIASVENTSSWESRERALKYAELVKDKVYKNFYCLESLSDFFSRIIKSFNPREIETRLKGHEFAARLVSLIHQDFLATKPDKIISENDNTEIKKMINNLFKPYIESIETLNKITQIFTQRVIERSKQDITICDQFPEREFIQDTIEQVLKDIGEVSVAEGYMIYREGRRKIVSGEITEAQFTDDGLHRDSIRKTLLWNIQNECDSIFSLNNWVLGKNGKDFKELMKLCDQRFYNDISNTVKKIVSNSKEIKVVIIAGPSCSNKTTTTTIIGKELEKSGLKLKQLNIDDYFFDLESHPKDEFGDYDFEMPEALDIKLLNQNLHDLISGNHIKKPIYNFKTGRREGFSDFYADKDEIILIDCLHGLYKKLTEAVPHNKKFKIYIESSNMLRNADGSYTKWTDVRLSKRMIRDVLYRNYDISTTLGHWVYVRKGELKHIIPYIYSVDTVLNAGLPYELPVLKSILQKKLPSNENLAELQEKGRLDAYIRGIRLKTLFDTIAAYEKIENVSPYSPIREFIGGSAYEIAHNS